LETLSGLNDWRATEKIWFGRTLVSNIEAGKGLKERKGEATKVCRLGFGESSAWGKGWQVVIHFGEITEIAQVRQRKTVLFEE